MCVCVCIMKCECSFQALNKFIEKEINPYVDEWEKAHSFPAHKVMVMYVCVYLSMCV